MHTSVHARREVVKKVNKVGRKCHIDSLAWWVSADILPGLQVGSCSRTNKPSDNNRKKRDFQKSDNTMSHNSANIFSV